MKTEFPFVSVPDHLRPLIGEPDSPGTRMYHQFGTEDEMYKWFEAVVEICKPDGSVSPGGAAGYARVSRAGVHKRLKEGRLTAFRFNIIKDSRLFKNKMVLAEGRTPYTYIPVSECKAWRAELERITDKDLLEREVMGDKDWTNKAIKSPPLRKWQRKVKSEKVP